MIGNSSKTLLVCLALPFVSPAFSQMGGWSPPAVLGTGGQGWQAAAAIDGTGSSVAVWDEITSLAQLWSRSKPNGGNWGSVTEFSLRRSRWDRVSRPVELPRIPLLRREDD
jgi:hypothetical protein